MRLIFLTLALAACGNTDTDTDTDADTAFPHACDLQPDEASQRACWDGCA